MIFQPRRMWLITPALQRSTTHHANGKPMTYAADHTNSASYVSCDLPMHKAIEKKVGILRHIFDAILNAMHESRRRQAEREIAYLVARQGGRITDGLEREMTSRLFT